MVAAMQLGCELSSFQFRSQSCHELTRQVLECKPKQRYTILSPFTSMNLKRYNSVLGGTAGKPIIWNKQHWPGLHGGCKNLWDDICWAFSLTEASSEAYIQQVDYYFTFEVCAGQKTGKGRSGGVSCAWKELTKYARFNAPPPVSQNLWEIKASHVWCSHTAKKRWQNIAVCRHRPTPRAHWKVG